MDPGGGGGRDLGVRSIRQSRLRDELVRAAHPLSQCNHSIEKALEEFAFSERARLEPDVSSVNGTYLGIVTGVGERHIEMVLRDEERTLHWPEPLPFSVSPGEELAAQVDESSATFYFLEGSLALFRDERADPRQDGLR